MRVDFTDSLQVVVKPDVKKDGTPKFAVNIMFEPIQFLAFGRVVAFTKQSSN